MKNLVTDFIEERIVTEQKEIAIYEGKLKSSLDLIQNCKNIIKEHERNIEQLQDAYIILTGKVCFVEKGAGKKD